MQSVKPRQVCKLALVPLALCLATGLGKAEDAYRGKFTLPFEARWQNVVLSAGDYTISMHSTGAPYMLVVEGAGKSVLIRGLSGETRQVSGTSRLTLVRVGEAYVVRSLEAGRIGMDIDYSVRSGKATKMATVSVPVEHTATGR